MAPGLAKQLVDFQRAVSVMRRDDAPGEWARLQHNLGETYRLIAAGGDTNAGEHAIEHLSRALEVFTADKFPVDFGLAANSLGLAYLNRDAGERCDNIETAIIHLQAALRVRPRDEYPDYWAKTQINLGGAFAMRLAGDNGGNIEAAICHLSAPLTGPAAACLERVRGGIERQLADAYLKRTEGQRSENLNIALQHARNAAKLSAEIPSELGRAHCLIGTALAEQSSRSEEESDEAIESFESSLAIGVGFHSPLERALAEQTLAILYEQRKAGDKSVNQRHALAHYAAARELYQGAGFTLFVAICDYWMGCVMRQRRDIPEVERLTAALQYLNNARNHYPDDAAASLRINMQMEVGETLLDLAGGDRGDHIVAAISHLQAAFAALDDNDPRLLRLHNSLGVALFEWRGGDRAANLESAITHHRAVLATITLKSAPEVWARAHFNLGNVYTERPMGHRSQNIEAAIECFNAALTVYTREAAPEDWAMSNNSLGGAYTVRIRGDRSENFERAIRCYDNALEVYTEQNHPVDWAMALHNLGIAYLKRVAGYEPENIERAIRALEQSLIYRTQEAMPFYWAMTHANLGTAYAQREYGLRQQNLAEAVRHYRNSLQVYTQDAATASWAWVQHLLGKLPASSGLSMAERIEHLTAALDGYGRNRQPERWALTQINLAKVFREQSRTDVQASHQAIAHLQEALEVLTPEELPRAYCVAHINLADEYLLRGAWQKALGSYRRAIDVGESLLAAAYSEYGRLEESNATNRLFTHAAYCLLELGEVEECIVQLDAGRARQLAERLARDEADLDLLPEALGDRIRQARETLNELEAAMRIRDADVLGASAVDFDQLQSLFPEALTEKGPGYTMTTLTLSQAQMALGAYGVKLSFSNQLRDARQALDVVVREARATIPGFMHAGIEAGDISACAPAGGALITITFTPAGSAAVVIPHDSVRVDSSHTVTLGSTVHAEVNALTNRWLNAYRDAKESAALAVWQDTIEATTRALWDLVIAPIQDRLERLGLGRGAPVTLMPQSNLALLPLHAAWREVEGQRRAFLDDHAVSYAPSLYALQVSQQRLKEPVRQQKQLLAIINPTQDLPYAELEGALVASHFNPDSSHSFSRGAATEVAVAAAVGHATYLHFASHGLYDWQDIMRSHLLLAGGSRLTLSRVMSADFDLGAARLVVLSACETGLSEIRRAPDEFIGLPAGFMEGGAPGVVSTLWSINDLSTALLFEEFYRHHIDADQDLANALRRAQLWLRDSTAEELGLGDLWQKVYETSDPTSGYAYRMMRYYRANPGVTPYAAPYYWAAFSFTGA
tara:strand:- start:158997 stop:162929 length:3933 start_codon:yes stop_codon:yes gene_type:complete